MSWCPASSSPIRPRISVAAPRLQAFSATLAAPPAVQVSRRMSTTGTGASGEIRVASPDVVVKDHVPDHYDPQPGYFPDYFLHSRIQAFRYDTTDCRPLTSP